MPWGKDGVAGGGGPSWERRLESLLGGWEWDQVIHSGAPGRLRAGLLEIQDLCPNKLSVQNGPASWRRRES